MNSEDILAVWAPGLTDPALRDRDWSRWAKPVLFIAIDRVTPRTDGETPIPAGIPDADGTLAVILDLPGRESVRLGVGLAGRGYRPVPLFNGCPPPSTSVPGMASVSRASALVDSQPIQEEIVQRTPALSALSIPPSAPPVFLLDSGRMSAAVAKSPGKFDNRWVVLPQDFPSSNLLLSRGVQRALLVAPTFDHPAADLSHILFRWQEAGMAVLCTDAKGTSVPAEIRVKRPSSFEALSYAAVTLLGLRRNSAGGFGGIIPQPSQGGGGFG